eukprot:13171764-Alexandrium_andersonii.AAC.1
MELSMLTGSCARVTFQEREKPCGGRQKGLGGTGTQLSNAGLQRVLAEGCWQQAAGRLLGQAGREMCEGRQGIFKSASKGQRL